MIGSKCYDNFADFLCSSVVLKIAKVAIDSVAQLGWKISQNVNNERIIRKRCQCIGPSKVTRYKDSHDRVMFLSNCDDSSDPFNED